MNLAFENFRETSYWLNKRFAYDMKRNIWNKVYKDWNKE